MFQKVSLLIIYICAGFGIFFGIVSMIISGVILSLYIGLIGIYGVGYGFMKIYSLRNEGRANAKTENKIALQIAICATSMAFIVFSFTFVVAVFKFQDSLKFTNVLFIYYFGYLAVWNFTIAVFELLRTIRSKSKILRNIKLMDFVHAIITLGIAQRIILLYVGEPHAELWANLGCFVFSITALLISLYMFKKLLPFGKFNK